MATPTRVFFRTGPFVHSLFRNMLAHPPEGYQFVLPRQNTTVPEAGWSFPGRKLVLDTLPAKLGLRPFSYLAAYESASVISHIRDVPKSADLIFSAHSLLIERRPWMVMIEHVGDLCPIMYDVKHLSLYRRFLEKTIRSPACRKVLSFTEAGRRTVLLNLDLKGSEHKVGMVRVAVEPRPPVDRNGRESVTLLHVGGSSNTAEAASRVGSRMTDVLRNHFYQKGGRDVLEAFKALVRRYDHIRLVMQGFVPPEYVPKDPAVLRKLTIIDRLLSQEELGGLFSSADIFVFPSHYSPAMIIPEAMSYGLPVVTTDVWSNPEMVEDGRTGLLVEAAKRVPCYYPNFIPNWGFRGMGGDYTGGYTDSIKQVDPEFVERLVEALSKLIEDPSLRVQLGAAGRDETVSGRFSIETTKSELKRAFDDALSA